jgi:hypothetical protein
MLTGEIFLWPFFPIEIYIENVEKLGSYASINFEPKLIQKEVLYLFDLYCKVRRIEVVSTSFAFSIIAS